MPRSAATSAWKAGAVSALAASILVGLAYRWPAELEVDFSSALEGSLAGEGFYDAEGAYRWSRGRAEIEFPDPGARNPVEVTLRLSGFRPRGSDSPRFVITAGDDSASATASRRAAIYSLETETRGLWSSTLVVQIRTETFVPGDGDERALGLRLHEARLDMGGPAIPPLKQILAAALIAFAVFAGGGLAGVSVRARLVSSTALSQLHADGFAFFRFEAALLTPPLALALAGALLLSLAFPASTRFVLDASRFSAEAAVSGIRVLGGPLAVVFALAALGGTFLVYAVTPFLRIPLASGQATPIAERFGAFDRDPGGTTFRSPFPGASLDLRDFGGSHPWKVAIQAALADGAEAPAQGVLMRAAGVGLESEIAPGWTTYRFELDPAPFGWRSGHVLEFPGGAEGRRIRVASVEIDRGRSLPSLRALTLVLGSFLLSGAALGACGLPARGALVGGAFGAGLAIAGLALAPVVFVPGLERIALAALAGWLIAALTRGTVRALSARTLAPALPTGALGIATAGFVLWFLSAASPFYTGGHFGYHTSVAEEIAQGKFLLYYFPGPDNMLSRQPQWGNLTVPHPNLFHTLAAPLALLPREGFYLGTKLFLALLLFTATVEASLVAVAAGGERAGTHAAITMVGLPTSSQLLGLGHLMTILGMAMAAVALGFIAVQAKRLETRRVWSTALVLLSLAFVSYTGSLLFGSVSLMAAALLLREEKILSKRVLFLLLGAWGTSLLLYYVHWVPAFFGETLPAMVAGGASDRGIDLTSRLRLAPTKLDYTFGSWVLPLVGLAGLGFAEARPRRVLLWSWALVLPVFCLLDLFFNFLLKHHYFTLPVVAVGLGLGLQWLERKKRWGRMVFVLFLVSLCSMGAREMIRTALGGP